tara:strand:+ start:138 stop:281 length:144 start_codon:yes stop_codon:yes gene_type:complete
MTLKSELYEVIRGIILEEMYNILSVEEKKIKEKKDNIVNFKDYFGEE